MTERMTDQEVRDALNASDSPLEKARRVYSDTWGKIANGMSQLRPISPLEVMRQEFEAVREIAKALGVKKKL